MKVFGVFGVGSRGGNARHVVQTMFPAWTFALVKWNDFNH